MAEEVPPLTVVQEPKLKIKTSSIRDISLFETPQVETKPHHEHLAIEFLYSKEDWRKHLETLKLGEFPLSVSGVYVFDEHFPNLILFNVKKEDCLHMQCIMDKLIHPSLGAYHEVLLKQKTNLNDWLEIHKLFHFKNPQEMSDSWTCSFKHRRQAKRLKRDIEEFKKTQAYKTKDIPEWDKFSKLLRDAVELTETSQNRTVTEEEIQKSQ